MGYIGRKRKWKSGDRPSEPANPSGQSSPQPGPSGEPAALGDDQAGASSKRSRPGTASPLPRAAPAPTSPLPGASTELAAHGDNSGAASSMSSRPGVASPLPRAVNAPRSPKFGTFREHVALAGGAASSISSRPGAASYLPRAADRPRSPQPVASRQVFEPMEVPGAGPAYYVDGSYPPHAPPQVLARDPLDLVVATTLASLPRSTADALAMFSTLVATLLLCGGNDLNTTEMLELFLGETNHELSTMIYEINAYYNGGFPLVLYDPEIVPEEETQCPVCLDDYEVGDELSGLRCQHMMHNFCLQRWLERSRTCPVCRAAE